VKGEGISRTVAFTAGPQTSYWLCKWMNEWSYKDYMFDQGMGDFPADWTDYILEYTINGKTRWW
jgi:hypothetical protein